MKLLFSTVVVSALAIFAQIVSAQSVAFSKPAGFVTHTLRAGQLNLIGLTLHEPVVLSGFLNSVDGTQLTDSDVDYDAVLTSGRSYILEIISNEVDPSLNGVIQIVSNWTGNTLTTPDNLGIDGLASGAKYHLRAPKTLADLFGVSNSAGLTSGVNMASADVVWLHNGSSFDKFYYSPGGGFGGGAAGWKGIDGGDASAQPIIYTDAIIIQSRSSEDKALTISGVVKTELISLALLGGKFNFVSSTFPVGSTLANSGLETQLTSAPEIGQSDVVWMPDGEGNYQKYYFSPDGWKSEAGEDAAVTPLTSGIIIERLGVDANAKLTPPESYDDL